MKRTLINPTTILSVLPVLLVIISLTANAQTSNNYNLSAYKLPEIRYQELETKFDLSGNTGSAETGDDQVINRKFYTNAGAGYNSYLNSAKTQRNQYISLSFQSNSLFREDSTNLVKNSDNNASVSYQIDNKRYFSHKLFIGTGLSASYNYSHYKDYGETDLDTVSSRYDFKSDDHYLRARIPLEFGIGRVELVQDYLKAIYIYEDLLKSDRIAEGKSEEEIMELANLVSRLRSKRYFDFRIKNIQDIEALDSFLIANNFKTISDARYFATLVDNWNFVNYFDRRSGTTIALTFTPEYRYEMNNGLDNLTDLRTERETRSHGLYGGINFEHYKPLNLYWQSNTILRARAGFTETTYNNSFDPEGYDNSSRFTEYLVTVNQNVSYYPNTRTEMSAGIGVSYVEYPEERDQSENITRPGRQNFYSSFSLSVDYYISPKLRLDVNTSISYVDNNITDFPDRKYKSFYSSFSTSLGYSIF